MYMTIWDAVLRVINVVNINMLFIVCHLLIIKIRL